MVRVKACINSAVAAIILGFGMQAQAEPLAELYSQLATAEEDAAPRIADRIRDAWHESGSPAMDLLLSRGEAALAAGDTDEAIGHYTALVDHAPEFVQGYVARAAAYALAGRTGPALSDLRAALVRDPNHFEALEGVALILQDAGRLEAARSLWEQVARVHPHSAVARQARAALRDIVGEADA